MNLISKSILFVAFIGLTSITGISQTATDSDQNSYAEEEITWSRERPITWDDFKPIVGPPELYKAYTYSGIRYEVTSKGGIVQIAVIPFFMKNKSWVHHDYMTDELLRHEQGHFNITALYAYKIDKACEKYEVSVAEFMKTQMIEEVSATFEKLYADMENQQKIYDWEADHGVVEEAQTRWMKYIDQELNRYTDTVVTSSQLAKQQEQAPKADPSTIQKPVEKKVGTPKPSTAPTSTTSTEKKTETVETTDTDKTKKKRWWSKR